VFLINFLKIEFNSFFDDISIWILLFFYFDYTASVWNLLQIFVGCFYWRKSCYLLFFFYLGWVENISVIGCNRSFYSLTIIRDFRFMVFVTIFLLSVLSNVINVFLIVGFIVIEELFSDFFHVHQFQIQWFLWHSTFLTLINNLLLEFTSLMDLFNIP